MILNNALIADPEALAFRPGSIRIRDGTITALSATPFPADGDEVIDCAGRFVAPGLADGHIHIESSRLAPAAFAAEAVAHGTTAVFADPHEIANVLGVRGVEYFLDAAAGLPLDLFVGVPSCVPATHLETAGGAIGLAEIRSLLGRKGVYGLAEMMNFPAIIHGFGDARARVAAALDAGKVVDGHAPGLRGTDLRRYIANGADDGAVRIMSDHECTSFDEAWEKHTTGMHIMLRWGSSAADLPNLLPGFAARGVYSERLILVSDDVSADELRSRGHVNFLHASARAILEKAGLSREQAHLHALRMCTAGPCGYFRVPGGTIAVGGRANLIVYRSLETIHPDIVIHGGRIVAQDGATVPPPAASAPAGLAAMVHVPDKPDLEVPAPSPAPVCRVIGLVDGAIVTTNLRETLPVRGGLIQPDPSRRIARLAVIERHRGTGNIGRGFVRGFPFIEGAIASTVAHDSHNLIVAGYDTADMKTAVTQVAQAGGGMAAVFKRKICLIPLDIAGLMSSRPAGELIAACRAMATFTRAMGCDRDPFATLAFLALPVIPVLKLTDRGLVDVGRFDFVPLIVE
ncbi:MAG: adenine deaminase C-terminal domain-containing protein [Planctomycetota bacterium]